MFSARNWIRDIVFCSLSCFASPSFFCVLGRCPHSRNSPGRPLDYVRFERRFNIVPSSPRNRQTANSRCRDVKPQLSEGDGTVRGNVARNSFGWGCPSIVFSASVVYTRILKAGPLANHMIHECCWETERAKKLRYKLPVKTTESFNP